MSQIHKDYEVTEDQDQAQILITQGLDLCIFFSLTVFPSSLLLTVHATVVQEVETLI